MPGYLLVLLLSVAATLQGAARPLSLAESAYRLNPGRSAAIRLYQGEALAVVSSEKRFRADSVTDSGTEGIGVYQDEQGLYVAVSPLKEPGEYVIQFTVTDRAGSSRVGKITVTVEPHPAAAGTVVLLLNGWGPTCFPSRNSQETFGNLQSLLKRDGRQVEFFDNISECCGCPIEQLGNRLGQYMRNLGAPEYDIVAHSMGGLIARSYLSGKQETPGAFSPPIPHRVRKLITTGTPHFGADPNGLGFLGTAFSRQVTLMQPGSRFLWDLATWNQGTDDLRGVDALAIVGNGGSYSQGDGVVSLTSASFSGGHFALPDERTRVVPYCHTDGPLYTVSLFACRTTELIAEVTDERHLPGRIIRSFLADTNDWRNLGATPTTNLELRSYAGIRFAFKDAWDGFYTSISNVFFGPPQATTLNSQLSRGLDGIFVSERMTAGSYQYVIRNQGQDIPVSGDLRPGGTTLFTVKYPPHFYRVIPSAGMVSTLSVAPGSLITIYGKGLASRTEQAKGNPLPATLGGSSVTINGNVASLIYASDGQINAVLPAIVTGLARLTVRKSDGQVSTNLLIEPAVPAIFTSNGAGTGPAAALNAVTGQLISPASPATAGDYVSLFVTGLGDTRLAGGLSVAINAPELFLAGQKVPVSFAGRAPGFPGLDQVNFQIPSSIPRGMGIPLTVRSGGRTSNLVSLAIR